MQKQFAAREERRICERNRHQGQWRGRGRRCSRHQHRDSPAAQEEDHGEAFVTLQPMDIQGGTEINLQSAEEPMQEQVTLWEAHAGGGSWQTGGAMEDPHWNSLFLMDCTTWKGSSHGREQFKKGCRLWEGLTLEKFVDDSPLLQQVKSVQSPLPYEERATETTRDGCTDWSYHSQSSYAAAGEKVENSGVKLTPGRREEWMRSAFKIWVYFSSFYGDLIGNKLN